MYVYINVQYVPSQTSELQLPYIIFHRPNITPLREMNQLRNHNIVKCKTIFSISVPPTTLRDCDILHFIFYI